MAAVMTCWPGRTLYPPEKIAEWRRLGDGYMGLRTGIHAKGDWLFAVSGD